MKILATLLLSVSKKGVPLCHENGEEKGTFIFATFSGPIDAFPGARAMNFIQSIININFKHYEQEVFYTCGRFIAGQCG